MATNTYEALKVTTLSADASSVTIDTIPQNYTDLVLVSNTRINQSNSSEIYCQPNGVGTANKSFTFIIGNGSAASSARGSNDANIRIGAGTGTSQASGIFATSISNFMNYSNTTTFKTILSRGSDATNAAQAIVGTFPSTNAITSIVIYGNNGVNILAGSTFSLYGIRAEGVSPAPKATGGAIYSDSTHYYHVFGSTGVFTPSQALTTEILTIAGGGSGGLQYAGGGGAGGLVYTSSASLGSGTPYTCTVGAGAPKAVDSGTRNGSAGSNSTFTGSGFSTITANGGGYGGGDNGNVSQAGGAGGSGGGGTAIGPGAGGTGSQGFNGGAGGGTSTYGGGGGGSAEIGNTDGNGFGGDGLSSYSSWGIATGTGENVSGVYFYAGGGGGSAAGSIHPAGGSGGGGQGGKTVGGQVGGTAGTANTGGGGGAGWGGQNDSGAGGSGVVILRYLKA